MDNSHVFVIMGDITHLKCDAWLLPSDSTYAVSGVWTGAVQGLAAALATTRDGAYESGQSYVLPLAGWKSELPLPILTAVPLHGFTDAEDLRPRISAFIRAGAEFAQQHSTSRPGRPNPLLAMPFFGTDGGGGHTLKGDVLRVILDAARRTAAEVGVDVVLVLKDQKTFALAQVQRKAGDYWGALSALGLLDQAKELAELAKAGRLVPFMGAGTSMSAGAPSWKQLIKALAEKSGMSPEESLAILSDDLDARDQAAYVRARYEDRVRNGPPTAPGAKAAFTFNEVIAEEVRVTRYGLAPALLAGLRTEQAITLNYDELFEFASQDIDNHRTVIPDSSVNGEKWLLKLHGSVKNPETIVLTRDDYLGYNASREALSAVVKATLITHHLLFVGFGLRDDHFHEIIHDVRRAVAQAEGDTHVLATALTLNSNPLNEMLWDKKLKLVSMNKNAHVKDDVASGRILEIFLDALLAFATDSHSYLLADEYLHALNDDERSLREGILDFIHQRSDGERSTAAWPMMAKTLSELGMGVERARPPRRSACFSCGQLTGIPIVYGLPGADAFDQRERGEIIFGGCSIEGDMKNWHCTNPACLSEWA
jgi:hypothetical protein